MLPHHTHLDNVLRSVAIALVLLTALPLVSHAEPNVSVHVLSMGPDKYLFTRFGHIALMVEDEDTGAGTVYNFGEFDYRDPELATNLISGRLQYFLDITTKEKLVAFYRRIGRGLASRQLALDDDQKRRLLRRLDVYARPENRGYEYRHLDNNCCTRVRDLVDEVSGGALSRGNGAAARTYRFWLAKSLEPMPLARAGLMFALGPQADRPISRFEEQFYPQVLTESLDQSRFPGDQRPLVSSRRILSEPHAGRIVPSGRALQNTILVGVPILVTLGFVIAALFPRRRFAIRIFGGGLALWGLVAGVGGFALALAWLVTDHTPAYANENLLVFPVTHLGLAASGIVVLTTARLPGRWHRPVVWLLLFALVLGMLDVALKLGPFHQDNGAFLGTSLTLNMSALLATYRISAGNWRWR
jgi:hypothetical protein